MRSQNLDLLRFPLAIVVMTIHVWFPGVADATADVPALNALSGLVAGLLWDQSVPVYFFISGFVFFLNADMSAATYRRKLRNRTKSLLIPYIIWNTLAIAKLLLFALPCLGFLFADQRTLADMDLSAGAVAWSYWDISRGIMHTPLVTGEIYPIDTPLWFLRDLMIVVVTTPLLHLALRRARRVTMALLFAAWAASAFFPPGHHSQLLTAPHRVVYGYTPDCFFRLLSMFLVPICPAVRHMLMRTGRVVTVWRIRTGNVILPLWYIGCFFLLLRAFYFERIDAWRKK